MLKTDQQQGYPIGRGLGLAQGVALVHQRCQLVLPHQLVAGESLGEQVN